VRLRAARLNKGHSVHLAAGLARVSPALFALAERGRYVLSVSQARRIATALGVDVGEVEELAAAVDGDEEAGETAKKNPSLVAARAVTG